MDTFVRDSSAFRKARMAYVHDGVAWRDCQKVWVHDGVGWKQVFQKFIPGFLAAVNWGYTKETNYPDEIAISKFTLRTNGEIFGETGYQSPTEYAGYTYIPQGSALITQWGTPLSAGVGVAYWIKLVVTNDYGGGFPAWPLFGDPRDTWRQLNIERYWYVTTNLPYSPNVWYSGNLYLSTTASDAGIISSTPFYLGAEVY